MASYREMNETARDPNRLAKRLLAFSEDWTDWEWDFLESLARHSGADAITTRQSEKLFELRDDVERISTYRGFGVSLLMRDAWLARFDLDNDEDFEFIEMLRERNPQTIRRREAGRLWRCCRQLGVIEIT
jgi:hypothetical protein